MIEQDAPLLAIRVSQLSKQTQDSARSHAQYLADLARAELRRLLDEKKFSDSGEPSPQGAD
jgi:hypothetical protein